MIIERIEWHLENWSDYMKHDTSNLGYPKQSLCMMTGGASGQDEFQIMCDDLDTKCAQTMDSIIDSISKPQRTAINHHWLKVAHHYPTQELDLLEAYKAISKLADKKGLQ